MPNPNDIIQTIDAVTGDLKWEYRRDIPDDVNDGLAVGLAALGIYGVVAYAATGRTREIGIRIALGARRIDVTHSMLGQSAVFIGLRIALGLVGSAAATPWLRGLLFGLGPLDAPTFVAVTIAVAGIAALVSYLVSNSNSQNRFQGLLLAFFGIAARTPTSRPVNRAGDEGLVVSSVYWTGGWVMNYLAGRFGDEIHMDASGAA
ncbi:MAG: hypothetical protein OXG72_16315 [Acidobacteria bacterium]|nr:hypothetical protein [Acidobacteriota bacterium]